MSRYRSRLDGPK